MDGVKIHILGSCSGTEPYADRHHTSVAVETEKGLYWLDAGECNHHLAHEEGSPWRSFSFRIEVQGKKIFYSGDTRLEDLADTVLEETDLLMMETGHHQIKDVCDFLKKCGKKPKKLLFIHHGVEVLKNPDWAKQEARTQWGSDAAIAEDGMTIQL